MEEAVCVERGGLSGGKWSIVKFVVLTGVVFSHVEGNGGQHGSLDDIRTMELSPKLPVNKAVSTLVFERRAKGSKSFRKTQTQSPRPNINLNLRRRPSPPRAKNCELLLPLSSCSSYNT